LKKKQIQLIPLCKDNNGVILSEKTLLLEKMEAILQQDIEPGNTTTNKE
jgi:hypothetical protein